MLRMPERAVLGENLLGASGVLENIQKGCRHLRDIYNTLEEITLRSFLVMLKLNLHPLHILGYPSGHPRISMRI